MEKSGNLGRKPGEGGTTKEERRQKLMAFYATGGMERYVFMSEELPDLTGKEEDTLRKVALSPNTRRLERNLLLNIKDPIHCRVTDRIMPLIQHLRGNIF